MLTELDLPLSLTIIAALIGGIIGLCYGMLAETSKFCLRRALAGVGIDRNGALSVWIAGFFTALLGTQLLFAFGILDFDAHRLWTNETAIIGTLIGGIIFGFGMILTRGCISRLTVLAGTGNLRALTLIVFFGIVANATAKGVLSPLRTALTSPKVAINSELATQITPWIFVALAGIVTVLFIARNPLFPRRIVQGALLGLLVPLSWFIVSKVLFDEFDPSAVEGLSFTLPHADLNFWLVASTSIPVNFGIGFIIAVPLGALITSLAGKRFEWQSFESPRQTGRYFLGALLMGFGGVVAGGCSVGAGLAGVSLLSLTAMIALTGIIIGGLIAGKLFP